MDVIEFFSEFRRMCKSSSDCAKCEYHGNKCDNANEIFEKTVAMVEQWSREHPHKTRRSAFLEQYPEAQIDDNDVLSVCPAVISPSHRRDGGGCLNISKKCADCRREFWMQEVE